QDKFSLFHSSFFNNLKIIHIKESKDVNIDIGLDGKYYGDHILIVVEKNIKANIIENLKGKCKFRTCVVEAYVKENSELNYYLVDDSDGNNFSTYRGLVEKDGKLNWFTSVFSKGINRMENSVVMQGEGASSEIYNIYFGSNESKFDLYGAVIHKNRNCKSNMLSKGAVKDKAESINRGLIEIKKGFPGNNGYERQEALILNEGAKANAVPNLLIDNNDVRCTHGVVISQLDDEKLFYLMSRGLNKEEARRNYLIGYFFPVLSKFPEKLREKLIKKIDERLK
ncbi:MAG: SufD family Fe-S cluster assembly protein, partial [Nanoarchaeota archaeon]